MNRPARADYISQRPSRHRLPAQLGTTAAAGGEGAKLAGALLERPGGGPVPVPRAVLIGSPLPRAAAWDSLSSAGGQGWVCPRVASRSPRAVPPGCGSEVPLDGSSARPRQGLAGRDQLGRGASVASDLFGNPLRQFFIFQIFHRPREIPEYARYLPACSLWLC